MWPHTVWYVRIDVFFSSNVSRTSSWGMRSFKASHTRPVTWVSVSFIAFLYILLPCTRTWNSKTCKKMGRGTYWAVQSFSGDAKHTFFKLAKTVQVSSRPPLSRLFSDPETTLRLNPENCEAVGEASSQALVCNSVIICIPRPRSERIPFYQPQAEWGRHSFAQFEKFKQLRPWSDLRLCVGGTCGICGTSGSSERVEVLFVSNTTV